VRDTSGGPETSYESGEGGHKIAFDPRDISESAERSKQPKLTLMEEVLLLGLKDKQVCFYVSFCLAPTVAFAIAFWSDMMGRLTMSATGLPFILE
jgi:Golgi phosphoprotein 3